MNDALQRRFGFTKSNPVFISDYLGCLGFSFTGVAPRGLSRFAPTAWWKLTNQDNELKSQGGLMNSMLLREDEVVGRLHLPG